jgi:TetR/AcrR family transcriptional regulator, transcriptional repressor for nem operon
MDTQEKLLTVARSLMLRQGFAATTVDEICEKAKVTKGAFFYHFKSKDELGKAVLAFHCRLSGSQAVQASYHLEKDPLRRVLKYADFVVESVRDPIDDGCLVGVFSSELSRNSKPIREMCSMAFSAWSDEIRSMLVALEEKMPTTKKTSASELAGYFVAVFEGGLILSKAHNDLSPLRSAVKLWKGHIQTIYSN